MYIKDDSKILNEYTDLFIFIKISNDSLTLLNEFRKTNSIEFAIDQIKEEITKILPNNKIITKDKDYCLLSISDIKSEKERENIYQYAKNKNYFVTLDDKGKSFLFRCSIFIIKFNQKYDNSKKKELEIMLKIYSTGDISSIEEFEKNTNVLTKCSSLLTFESCFDLKFMPIVGHSKEGKFGEIIFYEALLDNKTDINTGDLITILEKYNYSQFLDFTNFCKLTDLLKNNDGFSISMNVGKDLIENKDLYELMAEIYKKSNINKGRLILEILEYQAINEEKLKEFAKKFKDLGCLIAIDDFGVGYHSLELICFLDFDFLKIRGELFVKSIKNNMLSKILQSIVTACKEKKIKFIVEQVSSEEYLNFALNNIKADCIQGFLYPSIEINQLIKNNK